MKRCKRERCSAPAHQQLNPTPIKSASHQRLVQTFQLTPFAIARPRER